MLLEEAETVDDAEHERLLAKVADEGLALTRRPVEGHDDAVTRRARHAWGCGTSRSGWPTSSEAATRRVASPIAGLPDVDDARPRRRAGHGRQRHRRRRAGRAGRARPARCRSSSSRTATVPAFVGPRTMVVACSFSGATDETVAAHRAVGWSGARPSSSVSRRRAAGRAGATAGGGVVLSVDRHHPHAAGRPRGAGGARAGGGRGRRACSAAPGSRWRPPWRSSGGAAGALSSTGGNEAAVLARTIGRTWPLVYGAGAARRGRRRALEEPGQRERQGAGLRPRAARGLPQRAVRMGPAR